MCYCKSSFFFYYSSVKYFFSIQSLSHCYWCSVWVHVTEKEDKNVQPFLFCLHRNRLFYSYAVSRMFNLVYPNFLCWANSTGEEENGSISWAITLDRITANKENGFYTSRHILHLISFPQFCNSRWSCPVVSCPLVTSPTFHITEHNSAKFFAMSWQGFLQFPIAWF